MCFLVRHLSVCHSYYTHRNLQRSEFVSIFFELTPSLLSLVNRIPTSNVDVEMAVTSQAKADSRFVDKFTTWEQNPFDPEV